MLNEWNRLIGATTFVFGCMGVGCQHRADRSPKVAADEAAMATEPDERSRQKSSVIYPRLGMSDAQGPTSGFRPEVLLVTVERDPLPDGSLEIPVRQFKDILREDRCSSKPACERLRKRFGEQYAVWNHHMCTGTFISPNEIITAEHCFAVCSWSKTYAIMGFYADHDWSICEKDGVMIMTVPAGHAIALGHVKSCEQKKAETKICEDQSCDLALVHVSPGVSPDIMPELRSLTSTDEPSTIGLEVYSHAWGLPLKRYEVATDSKLSRVMFTNSGAGSGSAMVNRDGEIMAVTSGTVPKFTNARCPGNERSCQGQDMTWHNDIRRIVDTQPQCPSLAAISAANSGADKIACAGSDDAPPTPKEKE